MFIGSYFHPGYFGAAYFAVGGKKDLGFVVLGSAEHWVVKSDPRPGEDCSAVGGGAPAGGVRKVTGHAGCR
jgi:hypothetical protein